MTTKQAPIHSGFGAQTTARDVIETTTADFQGLGGVRPWAMDRELAERLWMKSEEWTGVTVIA